MDVLMIAAWAFVLAAGIVIEVITVQFVSIWFALASVVSILLAALGAPRWAQFAVFAAVTAILLLLTRPFVKRLRGNFVRTNADMNIGMTARVTEAVCNEKSEGRATIGGVSWKAVSADGSPIPDGTVVVIKDIDGAKLIVSPLKEEEKCR